MVTFCFYVGVGGNAPLTSSPHAEEVNDSLTYVVPDNFNILILA